MSSKPTEPRSIASQLVFLFTLATAFLLACGLGGFYWIVVRQAFAEDNAVLADKITAIRSEIDNPEGLRTLQDQLNAVRPGEHAVYWVRAVDNSGRVVAESARMGKILPIAVFPTPDRAGPIRPAKDFHSGGRLFSLAAVNATVAGQPFIIQVAQDRSGDEEFTWKFGALLAGLLALAIGAAAIIATSVTRRGLRPLSEMTKSLQRISSTQLDQRLGPDGWPRELQPMARAFDDMLNRLEDSFTRLSQFSADLAHELRTPVANILGEAEVTLTRPRTVAEYREILESSVAECTRLSGVIENLLFLARAESIDRKIKPSRFDARAAIDKIATYYQTAAEERQIKILCAGGGELEADPLLFGRALSNLIDNSLRFTPDGGEILITAETHPTRAEISVRDTGPGIAPQHLSRVFDRFYRADSARSAGGTGLGLALVKSITDLHGGSAKIASEEGHGTTITLTFPQNPGRS
jgi:two-component system heavy metal sensor histidine kinase CusS